MIVDNIISMPVTHEPDNKIKKKTEIEEHRPVEEPEKDSNLELNLKQDKPQGVEREYHSDMSAEIKTYNAQGQLNDDDLAEQRSAINKARNIDMII